MRRQPVAFGSLRYSATRRAGGTRTGSSLETGGPPKAGVRNRCRRISPGKIAAAPFSGARAKPRRKAAPVVGDGPNGDRKSVVKGKGETVSVDRGGLVICQKIN